MSRSARAETVFKQSGRELVGACPRRGRAWRLSPSESGLTSAVNQDASLHFSRRRVTQTMLKSDHEQTAGVN